MKLENKVVLITGAGRGLGAMLAEQLSAQGARLTLLDLDSTTVEKVAAGLPGETLALAGNVARLEDMETAVEKTVERFGRLDVLVANAGITAAGTVEGMDPECFCRVIEVNLIGVWNSFRSAIPALRATRGYLLGVCSLAAAIHSPLQAHYTASKAGVEAIADCVRQEVAGDGIDVGLIYPTFAATDMMQEFHSDAAGKALWGGNRGPFAMVTPERVVRAMLSAIRNRRRRVVVPWHMGALVAAPGLFHGALETMIRLYGGRRAVTDARREEGLPPASKRQRGS